eukprot:g385.t1
MSGVDATRGRASSFEAYEVDSLLRRLARANVELAQEKEKNSSLEHELRRLRSAAGPTSSPDTMSRREVFLSQELSRTRQERDALRKEYARMLNDDWDGRLPTSPSTPPRRRNSLVELEQRIIDEKLTAAEDAFRREDLCMRLRRETKQLRRQLREKEELVQRARKDAAVSRQQLATLRNSPKKVSTTDPRAPVHVAAHQQPNPPSPHRAGIDPTLLNEKVVDPPAHSRDEKQWNALKKKSKTWKRSLQAPVLSVKKTESKSNYARLLCAIPNIFAFLEVKDIVCSVTPLSRALQAETKFVSPLDRYPKDTPSRAFWLHYIQTTHLEERSRSSLWLSATTGTRTVTAKMRSEYADLLLQADSARSSHRNSHHGNDPERSQREHGEGKIEEEERTHSLYHDLRGIENDVGRTFVGRNAVFCGDGGELGGKSNRGSNKTRLVHSLRNVLSAYCFHRSSIGYCQGMNFLAGMIIRVYYEGQFDAPSAEVAAFWTLISLMNSRRHRCGELFRVGLEFPRIVLGVHQALVEEHLPSLSHHLFVSQKVTPDLYAVSWFLTLFCNLTTMSLYWARRSMDAFLLGGWSSMHKIALAVLADLEDSLLKQDFGDICMSLRKPEELLSPDAVPASLRRAGHGIFALAGQFDISPLRLQRLERRVAEDQMMRRVERMLIEKNTELEREQERIRAERRNSPEAHKRRLLAQLHGRTRDRAADKLKSR